jgi:hypothetical protein
VRKRNLAEGLLETLMRSPWELRATEGKMDTEMLPPESFTDERIASLAHDLGASALLLYRIRPAGIAPWVKVDLILHDSASQRTDRIEASLVGRSTGLVIINPLIIALGVLAVLAAMGWAIVISFRGAIHVRVQWDSDAKDEMYSILISKTNKTPTIENFTAYRKKMEWLGKRKRRFEAWNIDQNTTFRGIPRGKWYVHLYGIYTRGRKVMRLNEPPQEAIVVPRRTAFVVHVLEAAEAEFKIKVIDDHGAVEGARVWVDEDKGKPLITAKDGCTSFKVPKGYHVIHVTTQGMSVERPYHVIKSKLHEMTINLVWERRQEYASRALERQVDDIEQYMAHPRQSGNFALSSSSPSASRAVVPAQGRARPPSGQQRSIPPGPAASPDEEAIVDLNPAPAAQRRQAPAPPAGNTYSPAATRATVSLKPLAPNPSQYAGPGAGGGRDASAPSEEAPLDLDMSGALLSNPNPAPPARPPTPTRKPGR